MNSFLLFSDPFGKKVKKKITQDLQIELGHKGIIRFQYVLYKNHCINNAKNLK